MTINISVVIFDNMDAVDAALMLNERHIISADTFAEMMVWRVPSPVSGSGHSYKYRQALVVKGGCVVRYDNEAGKGDHKHLGENEIPYVFDTIQTLLDDFWNDVDNWRP